MYKKWILFSLIAFSQISHAGDFLVEAFGQLPQMKQVKLSPSGDKFAYIRPYKDRSIIVVETLLGEPQKPVIFAVNEGEINHLSWANDERIVFNTRVDYYHQPNGILYSLNRLAILNAKSGKAVWPFRTNKYKYSLTRPYVVHTIPSDPDRILVAFGYRSQIGSPELPAKEYHVLIELDVSDGSRDELIKVVGRGNFITDPEGNVVGYQQRDDFDDDWTLYWNDDGYKQVEWKTEGENFDNYILHYENGRAYFPRVDDKGRSYVRSAPLFESSYENYRTEYSHDEVDVENLITHQYSGVVVGYSYHDDRYQTVFPHNEQLALTHRRLRATFKNSELSITSSTSDGRYHVVYVSASDAAPRYYLFDSVEVGLSLLGESYPTLDNLEYASTQRFDFVTSDDVTVPGYLTLPNTQQPAPLIVMPHGGPQARDYDDFSWDVQYLAQLGYAVYRPNFRGSSGYGNDYIELGYGEWGKAMQRDVYEGTRALLASGLVATTKPCVIGGSYGGYVAMLAATQAQDLYQCAVSFAGLSNIDTWVQRVGIVRGSEELQNILPYLNWDNENAKFDAVSPLEYIAKDSLPILLVHGAKDSVVPAYQTRLFADRLAAVGHEAHTVLIGPDANHWREKADTRKVYLKELKTFLEQYLVPTNKMSIN